MKQYPLAKQHRLYRRSDIEALFAAGSVITVWPVRCTFRMAAHKAVMVSAPKKLFRHATDRNRIKRLLRESYRINQALLGEVPTHLCLSYIGREVSSFHIIENAVKDILAKVCATNNQGDI